MMLYTNKEFANIITNCKSVEDVTDVIDYCFVNAVAIIRRYGFTYYNFLAFTIEQKLRTVEKLHI
jgi:hypothetical protein